MNRSTVSLAALLAVGVPAIVLMHEAQKGRERIETSRGMADERCDRYPNGGLGHLCYVTGFDMDVPVNGKLTISSNKFTVYYTEQPKVAR
jgi:hypothetical protein